MTAPVLAMLKRPGDDSVAVCLGCTLLLAELGLVEELYRVPMFMDDAHCVVIYQLAYGVTVADCQNAVRKRHIGPPAWGERS